MELGTIKRKERSNRLDFKRRRPAVNGIASCAAGLLAVGLFAWASIISSRAEGLADEKVGYMGLTAAIFCVVGDALALAGFKEREVSYLLPYIGLVINSLMLIYLVFLFFYGLF